MVVLVAEFRRNWRDRCGPRAVERFVADHGHEPVLGRDGKTRHARNRDTDAGDALNAKPALASADGRSHAPNRRRDVTDMGFFVADAAADIGEEPRAADVEVEQTIDHSAIRLRAAAGYASRQVVAGLAEIALDFDPEP